MIKYIPANSLGQANHGWLQARHHFSFGDYYDPQKMGFGALRVVNDDTIAPQSGFGFHPHRDMEIITYVRTGAITHQDNLGNRGRTTAGDVQVMSAGTGITHAEHNLEDTATTLYQIWIIPHTRGVKPQWASRQFPAAANSGLQPLASGLTDLQAQGALPIYQDATVWGGHLTAGQTINHPLAPTTTHGAYVLCAAGEVKIGDVTLHPGDAAAVTALAAVPLHALTNAELVLIEVPV